MRLVLGGGEGASEKKKGEREKNEGRLGRVVSFARPYLFGRPQQPRAWNRLGY